MSEWDKRELCPDGGCVGVLSSDGTCTVCGKRGRAASPAAEATAADSGGAKRGDEATDFDKDDEYYYEDDDESDDDEDDDDDGDDDDEGDADADEDGVASVSASTGDGGGGAWTSRKLCPDGGCIGVIGDNGACKVCGKPARE
jgi:hypothetical protein